MHAPRIRKPAVPSLEEFRSSLEAPSISFNHQSENGMLEWRFLAWTCGCAASYIMEHAGASDLEIDRCRRHGSRKRSVRATRPLQRAARVSP